MDSRHIPRDVLVRLQFPFQYLQCGDGDFVSVLSVGSGTANEDLVCGSKIARLFLVEDRHRVNDGAITQRKFHPGALQFRFQQRRAESLDAKARDVAVGEVIGKGGGVCLECREAGHVFVGYAVNGGCAGGNGDSRVHRDGARVPLALRHYLDYRQGDDARSGRVEPGRLDVNECDGAG